MNTKELIGILENLEYALRSTRRLLQNNSQSEPTVSIRFEVPSKNGDIIGLHTITRRGKILDDDSVSVVVQVENFPEIIYGD
jgi:hypothetical protein